MKEFEAAHYGDDIQNFDDSDDPSPSSGGISALNRASVTMFPSTTRSFGALVRSQRLELRLSIEALADCIGATPETIRQWEAEKRKPTPGRRRSVLRTLESLVREGQALRAASPRS